MTLTAKMLIWCKHFNIILENNFTKWPPAFRIGAGIIIDKAYIELDQVEDKDIREHVINSYYQPKVFNTIQNAYRCKG